jgi:nucleoside-diphosphate-sugar epimerase
VSSTVLRTTTALVADDGVLAEQVGRRLSRASVALRRVNLRAPAESMRSALEGVGTLVVLGCGSGIDLDGTGGSDLDLDGVRRLLAEADVAGVRSVVVLSSAMVYGAHADNPVPLTEDAPLRPEPSLAYAMARAELERMAGEFRRGADDRTVAILRPAIVSSGASAEWLRASPWARAGLPDDDEVAPRQFVHVDDVVSAVELACDRSLDGAFNVAPDGWIPGDTFVELAGATSVRMPTPVRRLVWTLRRFVRGPVGPPGVEPYTRYPWVIAADRLRAEGWQPEFTAEEVFVEADRARGWRALSPRARQELSLAGVAVAGVGVVVGTAVLVVRRRRR